MRVSLAALLVTGIVVWSLALVSALVYAVLAWNPEDAWIEGEAVDE